MKTASIKPILILALLVFSHIAFAQPVEEGNFKESDLVELIKLDPSFVLDIRYATTNNFVGKAVYPEARAFLQRPAAEALVKVNKELKPLGYKLLIFDGYRPWSITKVFWDVTPADKKIFVANPKEGSRHNRGCAIDLTLYNIATEKEVPMTSEYDEMTERSYPNYSGGTQAQHDARDLLRSKMEAHGFVIYKFEYYLPGSLYTRFSQLILHFLQWNQLILVQLFLELPLGFLVTFSCA